MKHISTIIGRKQVRSSSEMTTKLDEYRNVSTAAIGKLF